MNIKTVFSILLLVAALFTVAPASAQVAISSTTTSAAVGQSDTSVNLTSVTGMSSAGPANQIMTMLYMDRELMAVTLVPTVSGGTAANVQRGIAGTPITSHASGVKVWYGPPSYFPSPNTNPSGSCSLSNIVALPYINVQTGDLWNCSNGIWTGFNTYNDAPSVGAQLTTAATIAPQAKISHITGTTAVATITVPPALPATGGCIVLIPDAIATTTTTGNIALVSTFVVSKALTMCYDPGAGKWYPSY